MALMRCASRRRGGGGGHGREGQGGGGGGGQLSGVGAVYPLAMAVPPPALLPHVRPRGKAVLLMAVSCTSLCCSAAAMTCVLHVEEQGARARTMLAAGAGVVVGATALRCMWFAVAFFVERRCVRILLTMIRRETWRSDSARLCSGSTNSGDVVLEMPDESRGWKDGGATNVKISDDAEVDIVPPPSSPLLGCIPFDGRGGRKGAGSSSSASEAADGRGGLLRIDDFYNTRFRIFLMGNVLDVLQFGATVALLVLVLVVVHAGSSGGGSSVTERAANALSIVLCVVTVAVSLIEQALRVFLDCRLVNLRELMRDDEASWNSHHERCLAAALRFWLSVGTAIDDVAGEAARISRCLCCFCWTNDCARARNKVRRGSGSTSSGRRGGGGRRGGTSSTGDDDDTNSSSSGSDEDVGGRHGDVRDREATEHEKRRQAIDTLASLLALALAYRARRVSHSDLLRGLVLVRRQDDAQQRRGAHHGLGNGENETQTTQSPKKCSESLLREAAVLTRFSEAAYTGILLDAARYPVAVSPLVWLARGQRLTPWRRTLAEGTVSGDGASRSHEVAVLRFLKMKRASVKFGNVNNKRVSECTYFCIADPERRLLVVAVRGTQEVADLMTDLTQNPESLMVDDGVDDNGHVRQRHAGLCHAGVMNAAKKLAADLAPRLESLVGKGGDCRGFSLRFVGHSLGGSVAALAAFLLRDRFPQVRCIAQSPFPYLDAEAADTLVESGTDVTSFVFGDEFGPRTSAGSVLNLIRRAETLTAMERARILRDGGCCARIRARGVFPGVRAVVTLFLGYLFRCMRYKGKDVNEHDLRHLDFCFGDEENMAQDACANGTAEHDAGAESDGSDGTPTRSRSETPSSTNGHALRRRRRQCPGYARDLPIDGGGTPDLEIAPGTAAVIQQPRSPQKTISRSVVSYLIPGTVYHVVPTERSAKATRVTDAAASFCPFTVTEVTAEEISEIKLTDSLFLDHLPWRLATAIKWLAQS